MGFSQDETQFLNQTIPNLKINEFNSIEMPLPFRDRSTLYFPNNRGMALCRTKKKIDSLRVKDPTMLQMAMEKMAVNISEDPPKIRTSPSRGKRSSARKSQLDSYNDNPVEG